MANSQIKWRNPAVLGKRWTPAAKLAAESTTNKFKLWAAVEGVPPGMLYLSGEMKVGENKRAHVLALLDDEIAQAHVDLVSEAIRRIDRAFTEDAR